MLALVTVAVAVLFKFGPNVRVSFRWTLVGRRACSRSTWLLAPSLFGVYVANFASYANTYGALGGVVILMLWFYLTGLMLLVAAEITAMLAKGHEPERIEARRQEVTGAGPRSIEPPSLVGPPPVVGPASPVTMATRRVPPATTPAPPTVRAPRTDHPRRHGAGPGRGRDGRAHGAILGLVAGGGEEHDRAA